MDEEQEPENLEEEGMKLTPEQLLAKCHEELEQQKQMDLERGVRFSDEQFAQLKYETNDVKTLKNLTVRESTCYIVGFRELNVMSCGMSCRVDLHSEQILVWPIDNCSRSECVCI